LDTGEGFEIDLDQRNRVNDKITKVAVAVASIKEVLTIILKPLQNSNRRNLYLGGSSSICAIVRVAAPLSRLSLGEIDPAYGGAARAGDRCERLLTVKPLIAASPTSLFAGP
jgi:hypothetical protein